MVISVPVDWSDAGSFDIKPCEHAVTNQSAALTIESRSDAEPNVLQSAALAPNSDEREGERVRGLSYRACSALPSSLLFV